MQNRDAFSSYHPAVNFLYFALVLLCSMFLMHPVSLCISFISAICYYITLRGKKALSFLMKGVLPLLLLTAIINPAFNHAGQTILCYLPTGNPLTAESILYGIAAGVMLMSVLLWFACFTEVMTSDKFIYLFGKIIPAMSLVLSMTMRFVPRFKEQFQTVKEAQAGLGRDMSKGPLLKRIRCAVECFSIVVTWSLEHGIDTADSMKARGYGTTKRTAYSIYRFEERDRTACVFLLFCGIFLLAGGVSGALYWRYFPKPWGSLKAPLTIVLQIIYFALCLMPVAIDRKEERTWSSFRSNI
jgi:energy-coupling factor transport system permease protein